MGQCSGRATSLHSRCRTARHWNSVISEAVEVAEAAVELPIALVPRLVSVILQRGLGYNGFRSAADSWLPLATGHPSPMKQ